MNPTLPHHYVARLTLEALSPLSIAAGGADGVFDVRLVRDANGLPALPGTTLAGVLRHLHHVVHGASSTDQLFGYQAHDQGEASAVQVSWGAIQDSRGQPVDDLLLGENRTERLSDPLLAAALATDLVPIHRDRVRIGPRGAASDSGKFDRAVLPAGHRFSAEIALWSASAGDSRWEQLLTLLKHPLFRLGGGTRAGLGRVSIVEARSAHFDLRNPSDRSEFARIRRTLADTAALTDLPLTRPARDERFVSGALSLAPRHFWRIGQGDQPNRLDREGKPADLLPKMESRVVWADGRGHVTPSALVVPASSIKGVLAHRTAFHSHRFAKRWAKTRPSATATADAASPEQEEIFGFARDDRATGPNEAGRAGRFLLDDGYLTFDLNDIGLMMHNSIDRFSAGVRDHMLFMEELVWRRSIRLPFVIDTDGITSDGRRAFRQALSDLCSGQVPIGAGSSRGHGFCDGTLEWDDGGRWIES